MLMSARRSSRYALFFVFALCAVPALGGSLEKAKRMHDRLTGVPGDDATLADMAAKITAHQDIQAAYVAMQNPAFYNATLKNWAAPWTNRDSDAFAPLNDYVATIIGVVRDDLDYRRILYDNIIYKSSSSYSTSDNNAYAALEASGANLKDPGVLVQSTQTYLPAGATAGIMTTRAAARAFFIDGTNRAMFRFTLKNHLCHDMEQVQDITRPSDRIRKDVTRSPGGDSRIFMNTCIGCHSGMDPMAQAFAYYNFNYTTDPESGSIEYTPGAVQHKYHINEDHFPDGYNTMDDHWDNYWRAGPNTAVFGWGVTPLVTNAPRDVNGIHGDVGAKTMGAELANSEAFAVCSVKKVFKVVCLRDPEPTGADPTQFATMVADFKSSGYKLKSVFAEAAAYCDGQ
jgi:hypothetical protein